MLYMETAISECPQSQCCDRHGLQETSSTNWLQQGKLSDILALQVQHHHWPWERSPLLVHHTSITLVHLPRQPAPKTVQYQPPSFKLTRPTMCLTMNERIQVHHNYISAVSSLEHKKDLINRLKRCDTHNIPAYEAEMSHHMTLHEDVLERILNILKQDDYYRTLKDLPVIDDLTAYDDIRLFPELYDTSIIIERVTGEADLIKQQLR